jgi:protein TonB
LDETPQPDQDPPNKTNRYAEANQTVEREMAPTGKDSRDEKPAAPVKPQHTLPTPSPSPSPSQPTAASDTAETSRSTDDQPVSEKKSTTEAPPPLQKLTQLSPDTLNRIAREERRERIKKREDILAGDEIYLNLQHDYLISFFKRFSNRIEAVWNYPVQAAQRGEEGVLLLKITIDRKGELLDVDLQESSGSDDLDFEAIQAVYRAAPFGPVTSHWPHEQMKIYAHFQYTLANRYIYGR